MSICLPLKLDGKYEVEVEAEGRFLCLPVILELEVILDDNLELEVRGEVDVIMVDTLVSSFNG